MVGVCHQLDRPELFAVLSDTSPAVDCLGPHTTETYQIADLSSAPRLAERYPALEERSSIAEEVCSGDLVRAYVGAIDRQALYGVSTVAFLPTPQEWDAGARWVRCDLAIVRGETSPFEPVSLDFALNGAAATDAADFLTRCYSTEKDEVVDVRCTATHQSRDVNMWMPVSPEPSELEIVQLCVPSVGEWTALGRTTVDGVDGVLHVEDNGSLTLRCVAVESHVGS